MNMLGVPKYTVNIEREREGGRVLAEAAGSRGRGREGQRRATVEEEEEGACEVAGGWRYG
jgi:hypothetical protein